MLVGWNYFGKINFLKGKHYQLTFWWGMAFINHDLRLTVIIWAGTRSQNPRARKSQILRPQIKPQRFYCLDLKVPQKQINAYLRRKECLMPIQQKKISRDLFFSERYSGKGISWIKSYFNIRTVVCMTQNHDSWQMVPIAILPKINGHYSMTCSFPRTWSHAMNESDLYFHLWLPLQMYSKTYVSRIKIII